MATSTEPIADRKDSVTSADAIAEAKRRILIPIDGSENSNRAYKWYMNEMRKEGDLAIFIHVVIPTHAYAVNGFPLDGALMGHYDDMGDIMKGKLDDAKQLANKYKLRTRRHGTNSKAYIHIHPNAGEALVSAIKDLTINAVVMGCRGLGAFRRTFLGSVSDYVIHHSNITVAIIPPPDEAEKKKKRAETK